MRHAASKRLQPERRTTGRDDVAVTTAACAVLLEVATAPDEPGALYLSYMTTLRVTHAALSNLIRLCSAPSSESATPLVHGTPNNLVPGAKRHLDEAGEDDPLPSVCSRRGLRCSHGVVLLQMRSVARRWSTAPLVARRRRLGRRTGRWRACAAWRARRQRGSVRCAPAL